MEQNLNNQSLQLLSFPENVDGIVNAHDLPVFVVGSGTNCCGFTMGQSFLLVLQGAAPDLENSVSITVCGGGHQGPLCDATVRALQETVRRAAKALSR